jgi:orotate phosphoribosyltransferase
MISAEDAAVQTARILLATRSVLFSPSQPFTLTSGRSSPVYIDCRRLISFPRARRFLIEAGRDRLNREAGFEAFDVVAGGETAGIPYAAWMADALHLPMAYVRKKPKGFGRNAQIEGVIEPGQRVLLVEDLASEGSSKVTFIEALRHAEAKVERVFVIFRYGAFAQAEATLAALGVHLHALACWDDVLKIARDEEYADQGTIAEAEKFLADPDAWVPPCA